MLQTDIVQNILSEASKNEDFRSDLISNPKQTIESFMNTSVPYEDSDIVVYDQTNTNVIYINIPPAPSSLELTDEQLEAVAGGGTPLYGAAMVVSYGLGHAIGGHIPSPSKW